MTELESLIGQLRTCYASADRTNPGAFKFVASVMSKSGPVVCVVAMAANQTEAREAAAKGLTG